MCQFGVHYRYMNIVSKYVGSFFGLSLICAQLFVPLLVSAEATSTATTTDSTTSTTTTVIVATTTVAIVTATTTPSTPPGPDYRDRSVVEAKVRSYFSDIPIMIPIALCESRFRQYTDSGNVLDGGSGGMIGIYQISKSVHEAFAKLLGYDINTAEGNMGYARYLYQKEGTNPWMSSFQCWNMATNNPEGTTTPASTSVVATAAPTTTGALTSNLSFGMVAPQVLTLQQILNKLGYIITADGPGSPGNETTKFGNLTRVAIRKFQCANNIICTGDEGTTGYGYVGARTRAALLSATPVVSNGGTNTTIQTQTPTDDRAAKILLLQSQIDQHTKAIADLQSQINALKN